MKILYVSTFKRSVTFVNLKKTAENLDSIEYFNFKNKLTKDYDFFILSDPYLKHINYKKQMEKILKKLNKHNTLDFTTLTQFPDYEDKLFQYKFFNKIVKTPKTYYFKNKGEFNVENFPLMVKKRIGTRGAQNFLIYSKNELNQFLKGKRIEEYIIEEYIKPKYDIRVLVLNNKILTAVTRKVKIINKEKYHKIRVKISKNFKLTPKIKKQVMDISKKIKTEFCGMDFLIDKNNQVYFLECNIAPQFSSTEKVSKVKISKKLLDFIKNKHAIAGI